ncbi:MAG: hypothetical protein JST86_03070 [Bacteroidetes bacterium]|nr:hypothetical protein [Bacteroidota bacterium]
MINKVFLITGNKLSAFITDESSLKFSSSKSHSVEEFEEAYGKKFSLATRIKVKYESIKWIKKEEHDEKVIIRYSVFAGIPAECEFSFDHTEDVEIFFSFMEKERYFTRTHKKLTPFRAIKGYLIGLLATIGVTIFTFYMAIEIANGTAAKPKDSKGIIFNRIVGLLGTNGVVAIGAIISIYIIYKIWIRYNNPPNQTRLIPPNS